MKKPGYFGNRAASRELVADSSATSMISTMMVAAPRLGSRGSDPQGISSSDGGVVAGRIISLLWISVMVRFCEMRKRLRLPRVRTIGLTLMLFSPLAASAAGIAVLDFELNDLTLNPNLVEETERTTTLRPLLVELLRNDHNITVVENPASARIEADKGQGYLFDRPPIAAKIGREAGVDWIVSGRLHKASFLFVYLKAQLIDTRTDKVVADFVVEIKGPQKKMTNRGIKALAQQINAAFETLGAEL